MSENVISHSIKKREESWGTMYELYLPGWTGPLATLTLDERTAFGEPSAPTINWSATGSQEPEIAAAFAAGLLELSKLAPSKEPSK